MIYYLTALINGFFNSVNRMTNVRAGKLFGTANGACKSSSRVYSRDNARNHAYSRGVEPAASFLIITHSNAEHQRQ